jgi:signal transduction histidine kinase/ligand-binding sensor domain-containing protein
MHTCYSIQGFQLVRFFANRLILATYKYISLLFVFILFNASTSYSQVLSYDNWQVKNGLPQNSIHNLIQTKDGYIWMATGGGLVRYDGVKFKIFNINNTPILRNNRIRSLYETASGDLLIDIHEKGLIVYRNNQFLDITKGADFLEYYFNTKEEKKWTGILTFAQDKRNRIYLFFKYMGLVVVDPVTYQKMPGLEHLSGTSYKYLCSFNSEVYVEKDGNIFVIKDDFEYVGKNDTSTYLGQFTDNLKSQNWGIKEGKLFEYKNGKRLKSYIIPENIVENASELIVARHEDDVYISNSSSLHTAKFNLKTKTFTTYRNDYNIEIENLRQIFIDREGNIWFATSGAGLFKVKPHRFTYIDNDERILSRNYYPIVKDDRGHIFVGSQTKQYLEFDASGNYIPIPPKLKKELGTYYSYDLEIYDDALYFPASSSNNIFKIKNNTLTKIPIPGEYKITGDTYRLYRNRTNELLIGGRDKILKLVKDTIEELSTTNHIKFGNIVCFYEDSKNRLWVVSDKEIFMLDSNYNLLRSYKHSDDKAYYLRGIHEDKEGVIYVGSYGNGLTVIRNDTIYSVDEENGLFENVISTITEDQNEYLWFTGNIGLTRVSKKEIIEITKGTITKVNASIFNEETDVMRASEFNGGNQHPKCHLSDDVYLFPTINGCVRVDFADFKINKVVPPVHIESIRFGDSTYTYNTSITLAYKDQRLEIFYTALSFISPENVKFKYKLERYDQDWVDGGTERKTFYNKLPPGNYIFKVIACNNDGIWNEEGAMFNLTIVPPFYMTWWFRSIAAFLLLSSIVLIVISIQKWRRKKEMESEKALLVAAVNEKKLLEKINLQQKEQLQTIINTQESERKRIANDLHDSIGQLLTSVKINLDIANERLTNTIANDQLNLIQTSKQTIEQITNEIRNISYNLSPTTLKQFGLKTAMEVDLKKINLNSKYEITFYSSFNTIKLDPITEIILYRVFQELIHNVLKHSDATEITVQLIEHSDKVVLMVEDNGKGFLFEESLAKKDSSGLKNLLSRIESINGKISFDSSPNSGTSVTIEIPL